MEVHDHAMHGSAATLALVAHVLVELPLGLCTIAVCEVALGNSLQEPVRLGNIQDGGEKLDGMVDGLLEVPLGIPACVEQTSEPTLGTLRVMVLLTRAGAEGEGPVSPQWTLAEQSPGIERLQVWHLGSCFNISRDPNVSTTEAGETSLVALSTRLQHGDHRGENHSAAVNVPFPPR
jgi:hypothetical protein